MRTWRAVAAFAVVAALIGVCALMERDRPNTAPPDDSAHPAALPLPDATAAAHAREKRPRTTEDPPVAAPSNTAPRAVVVPVVGEDGKPCGGALVWERGAGPSNTSPTTGLDGTATVKLAPGRHMIAARGSGTGTTAAEVDVPPGAEAFRTPELRLTAGGVIRGRVVDADGKPLQWIRVRAWQENSAEWETTEMLHHGRRYILGGDDVVTDANGEFALGGLAPEPHKVYVDLLEHATLRAVTKERTGVRPGGEPIEFRLLPCATLDGQVVDARTKAPLARFEIDAREVRAADGRFRVAVGPGADGVLHAEIAARGHVTVERKFPDAHEGDELHSGVVELAPDADTGTFVVEATDASGTPVVGWRLNGSGSDYRSWAETCDVPSGVVRAEGVRSGEQTWWLVGDGLSMAEGTSTIPPGGEISVRVVLVRCGVVRVRLLGDDGQPLRYVEADVIDGGGNSRPFRFVFARPQGTLMPITDWYGKGPFSLSEVDGRLCGLPPATYTLRIKDKTATREFTVHVPESGETALDPDARR